MMRRNCQPACTLCGAAFTGSYASRQLSDDCFTYRTVDVLAPAWPTDQVTEMIQVQDGIISELLLVVITTTRVHVLSIVSCDC